MISCPGLGAYLGTSLADTEPLALAKIRQATAQRPTFEVRILGPSLTSTAALYDNCRMLAVLVAHVNVSNEKG